MRRVEVHSANSREPIGFFQFSGLNVYNEDDVANSVALLFASLLTGYREKMTISIDGETFIVINKEGMETHGESDI